MEFSIKTALRFVLFYNYYTIAVSYAFSSANLSPPKIGTSLSKCPPVTSLSWSRQKNICVELNNHARRSSFGTLNLQRDPNWIQDADFDDNGDSEKFDDDEIDEFFIGNNAKEKFDCDDAYYDDPDDEIISWEWESYQKTSHIFLPPPSSDIASTPKTIVHFIGGTLFGSFPIQFYSTLLEAIAKKSNSIIVATSIPVTFQSNPLDHDRLCYNIARSFRSVYRNAICDEYGTRVANSMKIVGLGHSLGSRLHCIISSNSSLIKMAYPREGNVLISFNNFNAISSVPGVKSLEKNVMESKVKNQERKRKEMMKDRRERISNKDVAWQDDAYEQTFSRRGRRGKGFKSSDDCSNQDPYSNTYYTDDCDDEEDDEDDEDVDLQEVVDAVKDGIENRLSSIRATLTPDLNKEAFEFCPTPDELWSHIQEGEYIKNVAKNLVVQFDCDGIDQSARLARTIIAANTHHLTKKNGEDCNHNMRSNVNREEIVGEVDLKFARLRGTHLTPVSYVDSFGAMNIWKRISAYPMDAVLKEALGEEKRSRKRMKKKASARKELNDLNNLVDSVVQYILQLNS